MSRPGQLIFRRLYRSVFFLSVFFLSALLPAGFAEEGLAPELLRCEDRIDPLGIDASQPRLSWIIASDELGQRQTAYRILVAGSQEQLEGNRGALWDSGRVPSGETTHIAYAGRPLRSWMACWWKVQV